MFVGVGTSTDIGTPFEQRDRSACVGKRNGGGQTGHASADDDHVIRGSAVGIAQDVTRLKNAVAMPCMSVNSFEDVGRLTR